MDLDVDTSEVFTMFMPLPYRILALFISGIWGWGFAIHYLHSIRIDIGPMIRYTQLPTDTKPLHRRVYDFALFQTAVFGLSLSAFWMFTKGDEQAVIDWEVLPLSAFFIIFGVFFLPIHTFHRRGRARILRMMRRILVGGIDRDSRFADLLLSDALTSYAKVLGDLWVNGCMFFTKHVSTTSKPDRECGGTFFVPLIIAFPSYIRFQQCIIEYFRCPAGAKAERKGHLLNALKYSTAFPVIITSAIQRGFDPNVPHALSEASLSRLWLLFVVINSFYSFYWDVTRDWDLKIFHPDQSPEYPLREIRHFAPNLIYYCAMLIDFCLRATWSLKLNAHLDHLNSLESGIFTLQLLEVFRRWMWTFLRVEKEFVARGVMAGGMDFFEMEEGEVGEGSVKLEDF